MLLHSGKSLRSSQTNKECAETIGQCQSPQVSIHLEQKSEEDTRCPIKFAVAEVNWF